MAKNKGSSLVAYLRSEAGRYQLELASLFVAAYAPYLLGAASLAALTSIPLRSLLVSSPETSLCRFFLPPTSFAVAAAFVAAAFAVACSYSNCPPDCFLVENASFKPDDRLKLGAEACHFFTEQDDRFSMANKLFQLKLLLKSGLGDETYGPDFIFKGVPPSLLEACEEIAYMMCGALDQLLATTGVHVGEIDILVCHVCMTAPEPSVTSIIVNRYKGMREDIKTYNLSGMGCAAGLVAVDLVKNLLRVHKNKRAVVLGNEGLTLNWYYGNEKTMLVPNCLFRAGSYALLLSNNPADRSRSKYRLLHSTRFTTGYSDASYNCIYYREDDEGLPGTSLSIKLLDVASEALALSIPKLLPRFMPASELLKSVAVFILRRFFKDAPKPYLPDFKKAFDHFCLHPGGKAVVDGIGKNLRLTDYDLEPSRMSLHRFGNTSSSGCWYAMAYCEAKGRYKPGDKIWQVSLGSGFKCNHAVWEVLPHGKALLPGSNPWLDCIHRYPVDLSDNSVQAHHYFKSLKELDTAGNNNNNNNNNNNSNNINNNKH